MMRTKIRETQRGQSLVLVALLMVAFLGILALAIDGGNLLSNRRAAQNSADAGALAGARTLCMTRDEGQAEFMASQYAVNHGNGAQAAAVDADLDARTVVVTATITMDTAFAHFVGQDTLVAQASAAAGCFNPTSGESVLPVAWSCRPAISEDLSDFSDCQEQALTPDELQFYLDNPPPTDTIYPELYVLMDSDSTPDDVDETCISQGGLLQCDLDGDGEDDLMGAGARSWLDLDGGGGGAVELRDWIENGFPDVISVDPPTWVGSQNGNDTAIYQSVDEQIGDYYLVPVFDRICDDRPDTGCPSLFGADDILVLSGPGAYYFRIITFNIFYVTCVDSPGVPGSECPGHRVASDVLGIIPNNTKTIEGYFVTGFPEGVGGGPGGGGIDLGVYTLYLTR